MPIRSPHRAPGSVYAGVSIADGDRGPRCACPAPSAGCGVTDERPLHLWPQASRRRCRRWPRPRPSPIAKSAATPPWVPARVRATGARAWASAGREDSGADATAGVAEAAERRGGDSGGGCCRDDWDRSAISGAPPKAHQATVVASSAGHADFAVVTNALSAAAGLVGHQLRGDARPHHSVRARRANRASQRPPRRAHRHPLKSRTAAPAATPPATSTASSYGSSTSSSPAYSRSTSAPSTSSQPVTSQSAASTQHTQSTQPAFGQNGTLGPGRGAPGTQ